MLIIMKKYSRIIFPAIIMIMAYSIPVSSTEAPELGDPYSQTMSLLSLIHI